MKLISLFRNQLIICFCLFFYLQEPEASQDKGFCQAEKVRFTPTPSNINALTAIACSALTHIENERKTMSYQDGNVLAHFWEMKENGNEIEVTGHCSVPISDLKNPNLDRHKVSLKFIKGGNSSDPLTTSISGIIAAKTVGLKFSQGPGQYSDCDPSESRGARLANISLGMSFTLQDLMDIYQSQRTGTALTSQGLETWPQSSSADNFFGLGLTYLFSQINGRRLAISATVGSSLNTIEARTANALEFLSGSHFFEIDRDPWALGKGFKSYSFPTNHFFETIKTTTGEFHTMGCSAWIFEGETSFSKGANFSDCKKQLAESSFSHQIKPAKQIHEPARNPEDIDRWNRDSERRKLYNKVYTYIEKNLPKPEFFSDKPFTFEGGRIPWAKEDVQRGYVVITRTFILDNDGEKVFITEHRNNKDGEKITVQYELKVADILK